MIFDLQEHFSDTCPESKSINPAYFDVLSGCLPLFTASQLFPFPHVLHQFVFIPIL